MTAFLLLQMAADQVAPHDPAVWAAMGFLTLGRRFLGVTYDIIDDRIDVVTRGTMGLTVACARCHDHKYDPIPTADYYSLYGVFQNCAERFVAIGPPPGHPTLRKLATPQSAAFDREFQRRQQQLQQAMAKCRAEATERCRRRVADYLLAQLELEKYPEERFNQMLSTSDLIPAFVRKWQAYPGGGREIGRSDFHSRGIGLPSCATDEFSSRAGEITKQLHAAARVRSIRWSPPPSPLRPFPCAMWPRRYGRLFVDVDRQWQKRVRR